MRCSVISRGLPLSRIEAECRRLGAKDIRVAAFSGQVFCDLEEAAVEKLKRLPGLAVKEVGRVSHQQRPLQDMYAQQPTYAGSRSVLSSLFYDFRDAFSPPLTGAGWSLAILDSGIRASHRGLVGKVVYQANFSSSPTSEDVFSHGTAVAYQAAGGRHLQGEESGLAPALDLWNVKVLDDDGEGSVESVVLGIEHVIAKRLEAEAQGLPFEDPMYPQAINLSLGTPDDGDPDNPLRLAIQKAADPQVGRLGVYAAAGNLGPGEGTVLLPAALPQVWASGVMTFIPFDIWQFSSRGPTLEGLVKPDVVFYGVDIVTASSRGDDAFEVKSGTSFASPAIAAGAALVVEMWHRLGLIGYEERYARWEPQEMLPFAAMVSRKPPGAPRQKDNTYGVGLPFGDLILRTLQLGRAAGVMESLAPALGLALAGTVAAGMIGTLRRNL